MPISIAKAQQNNINNSFLDNSASNDISDFEGVRLGISAKILAQYAATFKTTVVRLMDEREVTASGALLDDKNFRYELAEDGSSLKIYMLYYFDFPNKGVKGWGSSENAPGSPYQYKTKGMSKDGRLSIENYIKKGKEKIDTVSKSKDKAIGFKGERKNVNLLDAKTNTLVYMIKKYGIKTTNYFDDAVKETFKGFELAVSERLGDYVVFTLNRLNKQ